MKSPRFNRSHTSEERFWGSVQKTDSCWLWTGYTEGRSNDRRGAIKVDGTKWKAHRYSWVIHKGPIPDGLNVLHKCDNTLCVNPNHLFLGTHSENMQDAYRKGRKSNIGTKNARCKLTEDQVKEIRRRFLEEGGPKLAKEFGLERTVPWQIFKRLKWPHLKD